MTTDPHATGETLRLGAAPSDARAALVLLHGRGARAQSLAPLAEALLEGRDEPVAVRLPQASGGAWYPQRFVAPRAANQPWLDSALARVDGLLDALESAGLPPERIVLGGFSQGACLALDAFALRGGRLGGVIAYAGGLIGATLEPERYAADLAGTPVFLGSGDPDPHIPTGRVEESAELLRARGAQVDARLYPGIGHTVNDEELEIGRTMIAEVLDAAA
jgi:predicted esterase